MSGKSSDKFESESMVFEALLFIMDKDYLLKVCPLSGFMSFKFLMKLVSFLVIPYNYFFLSFNICAFFLATKNLMLFKIVLAAVFVNLMWWMAIFSSSLGSKIVDSTSTSKAIRSAPQKARMMVVNFPGYVSGEISPYPMVVMVITVNQTELK